MKTELKPYDEYNNYIEAYINTMPKYWNTVKLRVVFFERKEKNTGRKTNNILSVMKDRGVIPYKEKGNVGNKCSEDIERYSLVEPDDIVMNCMNVIIGSVGKSKYRGALSPVYYVLTVRNKDYFNVNYYDYVFRMKLFQRELTKYGKGILAHRMRVSMEMLKNLLLPYPPINEQNKIVKFLDVTLAKIHRFISKKKRLIAVLKEQKQTLINQAVTKGLDPNVNMKPSGIDWLEEIPEHWNIVHLNRFLRKIEQGWSPVAAEGEAREDQWAVVTLSAVKKGYFYQNENKPLSESAKVLSGIEIQPGDFLLTRSNTRSLVGDVCIVKNTRPKLILCDLIYRIGLDKKFIHPEFLMYQLLSPFGRAQIEVDARGSSSTMVKISHNHIKQWVIMQPPLEEQVGIADYINRMCLKIEHTINNVQHQIDLIAEYRTTLISDVVTGKVDVRSTDLENIFPDKDSELIDNEIEDFDDPVDQEVDDDASN